MLLVDYDLCCFFFKQKTAYEMRISDWSSDVCSSDLDKSPPCLRARPCLTAERRGNLGKVAAETRSGKRGGMARIVMKFGGTSMAGTERIRTVAKLVAREVANGNEVAVVVSAMAGETDRLVNFCREANQIGRAHV